MNIPRSLQPLTVICLRMHSIPKQRTTRADSPIEFYDFWLESFKSLSKSRLLELMAQAPDFEQLKILSQPELASIYAERMTYAALQGNSPKTL
jgi:hypothetical protein